jgi:predicted outer membrane repeat protein
MTIASNSGLSGGGLLVGGGGTAFMLGGALVANDAYAGNDDGARLDVGGALIPANVTSVGNTAGGSGGAVASQGDLSITDGLVTANTAGANGGGCLRHRGHGLAGAGLDDGQRRGGQWRRAWHRR